MIPTKTEVNLSRSLGGVNSSRNIAQVVYQKLIDKSQSGKGVGLWVLK